MRPTQMICPESSGYVGDAPGHLPRLRSLAAQATEALSPSDPHLVASGVRAPIRKFQRIMVPPRFVLIHLSENCRRVT